MEIEFTGIYHEINSCKF